MFPLVIYIELDDFFYPKNSIDLFITMLYTSACLL